MWQELQHITDHQQRSRGATTIQPSLPDELNEFNACFETLNVNQQRGHLTTQCAPDQTNEYSVDIGDMLLM